MEKCNEGASVGLSYIVGDWIVLELAFLLAAIVTGMNVQAYWNGSIIMNLVFRIIYILVNRSSHLYNLTTFFYVDRFIKQVAKSFIIAFLIVSAMILYGEREIDITFYVCSFVFSYIALNISSLCLHVVIKKGNKFARRTAFIGEKESFNQLQYYMNKSNMKINLIGYVAINETKEEGYLGDMSQLEHIIHENAIDQVYVMSKQNGVSEMVQNCLSLCLEMGVIAKVVMNSYQTDGAKCYVDREGTYPVITYHNISLNVFKRATKRLIDIFGAVVGIILFSPIMCVTSLAIKCDSRGPVIFKQKRVGMNGRIFYMYKFRSMCVDAEERKHELLLANEMDTCLMFKMEDDPRVTRVGKIIRKTSIDELPQFFNVLLGNMSLVGTRPPTIDEVKQYERGHWRRLSIKPGITGVWQVSGRSSIKSFDEVVEMDIQYIDRWSVLYDVEILLKTIIQVICQRGAC